MPEIQPSWKEAAAVAWLLVWRGALGGFAIGFVLGLVVNLVMDFVFGMAPSTKLNMSIGLVVGATWWLTVVRMALAKRYRSFRIALLPV